MIARLAGAKLFRITTRAIRIGFFAAALLFIASSPAEAVPQPGFRSVVTGLDYAHLQIPDKPWSIHIARLDRRSNALGLAATLGKAAMQGLGAVSAQAEAIPQTTGRPRVAINADFFSAKGDPVGLYIREGELVSAPGSVSFWMENDRSFHIETISSALEVLWPSGGKSAMGLNEMPKTDSIVLFTGAFGAMTPLKNCRELILQKIEGQPWLPLRPNVNYRARLREIRETGGTALATNLLVLSLNGMTATNAAKLKPSDTVQFRTTLSRNLRNPRLAVGGGPLLVKNGKAEPWPSRSASNPYVPRHPRTALGFDSRYLFLVVVDGRQPGLSIGMSMQELAGFMQQLGCTDAMNLDGGGSSTFLLDGKVKNSPSDGRERPVANALVIVERAALDKRN